MEGCLSGFSGRREGCVGMGVFEYRYGRTGWVL